MNKERFIREAKWYLIWSVIYFVCLWLYSNLVYPSLLQIPLAWASSKIIYYLVFGVFTILLSNLVYAGIKKRRPNYGMYLVYWILIMSFLLWVIDFIIIKLNILILSPPLHKMIFVALLLALSFKFISRIDFGSDHHGHSKGFKFPHFSLGLFIAIGIIVVAYFYSKSAHFFVYSMVYGIPLVAYWIIVLIICFIVWNNFDN